jgi:methylated-DNA-[protein]-cysteine S-methyltransferase
VLTTSKKTAQKYLAGASNDDSSERICIAPFVTELNWMAVAWRDDVLVGAAFGHASKRAAEMSLARIPDLRDALYCVDIVCHPDDLPNWTANLIDRLTRFAEGEPVDFAAFNLALGHLTPFASKVVAACRRIPWGQTRSYGELAAECGSAGAARAVGSVMAKNRFPLIVPCHRVLAAGGEIGGYSAPEGLTMKRRLLQMETLPPTRPK